MTTKKAFAKKPPAVTVIVRGSNGTYVGVLESRTGREVSIVDARWLYSWAGRFGLATLAAVGPGVAEMSAPAPRMWILDVYVVLECSEAAASAFSAVVSK